MIVKMLGVGMGSDENFMSRPCFLYKLQADFMNLLGGNVFIWRKGLHIMIKIHSAFFVMRGLGRHKFRESIFAVAVDSAHKSPPVFFICYLFLLQTVIYHRLHCADALIGFGNKIYGCHYPFLAISNSCSYIFFCSSTTS